MSKEKKLVEAITSRDEDFSQWHTVLLKADLIDYSSVRGCTIYVRMVMQYELIQKNLDKIKDTGRKMSICQCLFLKSVKKERIMLRFAPEVAWVTHGGEEKLPRLCRLLQRHCSVSIMQILSIPIETCLNYIINGVLFVGKDYTSVLKNA